MQSLPLRAPGMEAVLRRWVTPMQHAAPSITSFLLVVLLAWLLADLTWALIPQHAPTSAAYLPPPTVRTHQVDTGRIADRHLFGVTAVTSGGQNAPDTTLALTLHGIVAGKNAQDSRALIVANGDEEPYAVGASLPGGAVIRAIFPDRVMLDRNGRVEALRLPKSEGGAPGGAVPTMPAPAPVADDAAAAPQNLGELRQQIAANPEKLMDVVRAMPVQDQG